MAVFRTKYVLFKISLILFIDWIQCQDFDTDFDRVQGQFNDEVASEEGGEDEKSSPYAPQGDSDRRHNVGPDRFPPQQYSQRYEEEEEQPENQKVAEAGEEDGGSEYARYREEGDEKQEQYQDDEEEDGGDERKRFEPYRSDGGKSYNGGDEEEAGGKEFERYAGDGQKGGYEYQGGDGEKPSSHSSRFDYDGISGKQQQRKSNRPTSYQDDEDRKAPFTEYDADGFGVGDVHQKKSFNDIKVLQGFKPSKYVTPYITHDKNTKKRVDYEAEYDEEVKRPSKYSAQRHYQQVRQPEDEEANPERLEKEGDTKSFERFPASNLFPQKGKLGAQTYTPQYYSKFTSATPYERFSFKPAATGLGSSLFSRNIPAFNPSYSRFPRQRLTNLDYQPAENIPINVKSGCVKVNKIVRTESGRIKDKLMECSICRDPNTGEKTQKCSYEAVPEQLQAEVPRNKRQDPDAFDDPYEEIKSKSHQYYSKPEDFEKEFYQPPDFSKIAEEYQFDPKEYESIPDEKSYSEQQSEKLVQKGEHCRKVNKKGATCLVCKDPQSGGNYEQCSYESAPKEKKFAYTRQSKFDGDRDSESSDLEPAVKKQTRQNLRKKPKDAVYIDDVEKVDDYEASRKSKPKKISNKRRGAKKFDDFHSQIFPEFNNQESKRQETKAFYDYFKDDESQNGENVHKVLQEFGKKDRSKCKQTSKNGLTCYLCLDKKGIQHEECMYVSESRPKNEHSAYHKLERLKEPQDHSESMIKSVTVPTNTSTTTEKAAGLETPSQTSKERVETSSRSRRETAGKMSEIDREAAESQREIDVSDRDGYFSEETRPVFSKEFGVTLPRYMVEKGEFELDYDKTVARGV